MNISYIDTLKGVLPDFGPYIEHQFADQSEIGVSRGIKRFVNSLSNKKLFQAANQIDEWKRTHRDENVVQIIEAVREGLRVKISLLGIFILSSNPALRKMNRYALKEAIGNGSKKNYAQVANQIKLHPEYLDKVSKILNKIKNDKLNIAQDFCYILTQALVKEEKEYDTAIKLLSDFNDLETAKKLYEYFASTSQITKISHPFKDKLEKAFPDFVPKVEAKKEDKKESYIHLVLISTMAASLLGFALSFFLGTFILLGGAFFAFYTHRFQN